MNLSYGFAQTIEEVVPTGYEDTFSVLVVRGEDRSGKRL